MKSISILIVQSILLVVATLIVYTTMPSSDFSIKMMGWIGIIQLVFSIHSWSKQTGTSLTPYVIFIFAAYTFTFGQSILYVFDCVSPERDLMASFSPNQIYLAQKSTLIFLNFFHIGALLSCGRLKKRKSLYMVENSFMESVYVNNQISGIKIVGKIFLIISTIPFIIEIVTVFKIAATIGYGGLYEQEAKIGIFNIINILSQYFLPGILCLLIVEKSKTKRSYYIGVLLLDIGFWMFIGGRSTGVILAAILLMYYHIFIKKIKIKQALIVAVIGFFFVSFLATIADTRSDANSSTIESFMKGLGKGGAFFEAISEMGGSMFPMITTMDIVPNSEDYRYGSSYLWAATSVIPNLGFWDLHPAMKYANLNGWLQKSLNINYGPGFSIVAEAYINFGDWGFLMMIVLGYIFGMIFNIDIRNQKNPLMLVLSFVFCYLIIKTVRNSFLGTIRSVFYYILPIYLVAVWYKNGKLIK